MPKKVITTVYGLLCCCCCNNVDAVAAAVARDAGARGILNIFIQDFFVFFREISVFAPPRVGPCLSPVCFVAPFE